MRWVPFYFLLAIAAAGAQTSDETPAVPCAESVAFREIMMPHWSMTLLVNGPVVAVSAAGLRDLVARHSPPCDTAQIPEIDFDRETLIGVWIHLGNCAAGYRYSIRICRDDSAHAYRYALKTWENPCRGTSSRIAWVLVPKLPEGYSVTFRRSE